MPQRFHTGAVTVTVPATSANLGPGFDAFGLALSRYDDVTAEVASSGLDVDASGEGASNVPRDEGHLIVRSMRAAFDRLGGQPPGLRLNCVNRIPHGRGLGSSAAAIIAGVQLARALVPEGRDQLDDADALALASELEGHPDNVAACLLGGFTVAWTSTGRGQAVRVDPQGVSPMLFIPSQQSATEVARAALPPAVPHADAAFNAGRAALLVIALTRHPELLMTATEDRLHQSYRAEAMMASADLVRRLRAEDVPAVISGAGSSVLALISADKQRERARDARPDGWELAELEVSVGAQTRVQRH